MKRLLTFALCLFFFLAFSGSMATSSTLSPPPPEDQDEISILSTEYLSDWDCYLIDNGDGTVTIRGYSQANRYVDEIYVKLYLQKWDGSSWQTVSSGYRKTANDNIYVSHSKNISVQTGAYYRTLSYHQIIHNDIEDPKQPQKIVSDSCYID
ncbi:hypothetical protein [Desulfoscipio gibsoniae]